MPPKKRPPHLDFSLQLIQDERVNVKKRTERRVAFLLEQTDKIVDQATQTEIPTREVHVEVMEWHGCLNLFVRESRCC
jgi:hypothetical protein